MENVANVSIDRGPNQGQPSRYASRALGEILASLHGGLDPVWHSSPLANTLFGDEWQYGGMECTYVVEHAAWPGYLYLVYPNGQLITCSIGELPQQWLLID